MWTRAVLCPAWGTETERGVQDYRSDLCMKSWRSYKLKRINPWEKKYGQCDLGEYCAVRRESRIGKMCDCPQGAFCNFFLLKCL